MNAQSILVAIALSLVTAACTPPQIRKVSETSAVEIGEQSLVAFSIENIAPFEEIEFDIIRADPAATYSPLGQIAVSRKSGAEQLLVYELPADNLKFGIARFRYNSDWYETVAQGPAFSLAPGTLTYIGKIQLQSVRESVYSDTGREYPARVTMVVNDASEADMQQLASRYPSVADHMVKSVSSGLWAEHGHGSLRFVPKATQAGRHRPPDYFERQVEPTAIPPQTTSKKD